MATQRDEYDLYLWTYFDIRTEQKQFRPWEEWLPDNAQPSTRHLAAIALGARDATNGARSVVFGPASPAGALLTRGELRETLDAMLPAE